MKITWLGHASFLLESEDNTKIITDPYNTGHGLGYAPINQPADIVTISHGHGDHNNSKTIIGNPEIITKEETRTVKGILIKGISSYHDDVSGSERGNNIIFRYTIDGLIICHLGDLGHLLTTKQIEEINQVDILLIPIGGFFTINAEQATKVAHSLKAKVLIPMHYKTTKCDYPISGIENFIKGKTIVEKIPSSEIKLGHESLTESNKIIVLESMY